MKHTFLLTLLLISASCQDSDTDYKDIEPERTLRETTEAITDTPSDEIDHEREEIEIKDFGDNETTVQDVATEAFTMSLDNNVYEIREDIYSNTHNVQLDAPETTTRAPDTIDGVISNLSELDDEVASGQRSPKTENSDSNLPDLRTFEKTKPAQALSKAATLRSWLEDSWLRPPAGILVPLRPAALSRALAVWNDLTADGLNLTDIVIVGYDENGVNWRSRHNLQPSVTTSGVKAVGNALSKLLRKYQGVYTDSTIDGTMRSLVSATKLVPYDSALFLVTDKAPGDAQRLPLALRALVEKRLKVYTIWTDPNYPTPDSEAALQDLKNISSHTEGEVLPYSLPITDIDTSLLAELQQWNPLDEQPRRGRVKKYPSFDDFDTLVMRKGGGESISLGIPVENGVTSLKIYLEGAIEHAVLYPPNDGPQIDLYNASSIRAFSAASRSEGLSPREVFLIFPRMAPDESMLSVLPVYPAEDQAMVGLWHLSVKCDLCDYRLRVAAKSLLHFNVDVVEDMLKLKVTGPVASIRDTLVIDEYGTELAKLPFSYQPIAETDKQTDIFGELGIPSVSSSNIYVRILGRDIKGEPFTRLSGPIHKQTEVRLGRSASIVFPETPNDLELAEEIDSIMYQNRPIARSMSQLLNQSGVVLTTLQVGLSSRLYGSPGDRFQLYFEVTNHREQRIRFNFEAKGELFLLNGIEPTSRDINAGETFTVIVNLLISANTQPGRDLITFTAYAGTEQLSSSVYVYILASGQTINDINAPEVSHNFQGSCILRQGSDCAEYTWTTNVIARDPAAGLLRVTSSPVGVFYDSNFIAGSRQQLQATYRATCCSPRVIINAVDALGNTNSYTIDISNYLPPAAIAAIVLGVFLLIAIIALTIFLIYWCVRRRKDIRDLPTYTSRNVS
ncbi:unnamed protein product [Pieris brassicae]|uniref:VWFA domain-containing protein n=1 Tax=Pieris brassicae TaxID=7116 RepID=A0A9P0XFV6_PIEBR|nr:unnamed protein product [Pieris brassicae]